MKAKRIEARLAGICNELEVKFDLEIGGYLHDSTYATFHEIVCLEVDPELEEIIKEELGDQK